MQQEQRAACTKGAYVRIIGQLRDWQVSQGNRIPYLPPQSALSRWNTYTGRPRSHWRTHAFGLTVVQGEKTFHAFDVRAIQDPNEITYHLLEAIFAHCFNIKGRPGKVSQRATAQPPVLVCRISTCCHDKHKEPIA